MANYNLVIDSKYDPFTYQEMLAPVLAATQAHQQLEDSYSDLETQAAKFESLADSAIDRDSYLQYKGFADRLRAQADDLATHGLNASSRRSMMKSKADYASTIEPLEKALKKREAEALIQQQAFMNGDVRFSRDANTTSLQDYIKGVDPFQVIDSAKITDLTHKIAQDYARGMSERGTLQRLGLPFQYFQDTQKGFSTEKFLSELQKLEAAGNGEASGILAQIRKDVFNASGLTSWSEEKQKELTPWLNNAIYRGLSGITGDKTTQNYTDSYSMQNALEQAKEERAAAKEKQKKEAEEKAAILKRIQEMEDQERYLGSAAESSKASTKIDKYNKYFWNPKDGVGINKAGRDKFRQDLKARVISSRNPQKSEFYKWVEKVAPDLADKIAIDTMGSDYSRFLIESGLYKGIDLVGDSKPKSSLMIEYEREKRSDGTVSAEFAKRFPTLVDSNTHYRGKTKVTEYRIKPSKYNMFVYKYGYENPRTKYKHYDPSAIGDSFETYKNGQYGFDSNGNRYDVDLTKLITAHFEPNQGEAILRNLGRDLGNGNITASVYNNRTKSYEPVKGGNSIDANSLLNGDYQLLETSVNRKTGDIIYTLRAADDKGKTSGESFDLVIKDQAIARSAGYSPNTHQSRARMYAQKGIAIDNALDKLKQSGKSSITLNIDGTPREYTKSELEWISQLNELDIYDSMRRFGSELKND